MKKNLIILMTILSIGIIGCANSPTEELTKEEQEAIYREEVRKKLDEEEETTISETEEAEELESEEEPGTEEILSEKKQSAATFDTLPAGVQASVISTFYDERATADSLVNGGMSTAYSFDNQHLIIMVTSGVGSGHPIYLLERQDELYVPVDGVVYVSANTVESAMPAEIEVTIAELQEEYEANQSLYDQTDDPTYTWDMTVEDFQAIKSEIGQATANSPREATTPVIDEVIGTVNEVTATIHSFYTIGGSVAVEFSIFNGSGNTIEYSPYDIELYKNGELVGINDTGESGMLAPGETGTSYVLFQFMDLEPYVIEWQGHQLVITPSIPQ